METINQGKKPPAVFVARASSEKQADSVQSQLENDYPYFAEMYNILETYNEGTISASADKHKRKEHARLIHDLTEGKFAKGFNGQRMTICCRESSRFTREDVFDEDGEKAKLVKVKIKIHGRNDGIVDLGTQGGKIVHAVKAMQDHEHSLTVSRHACVKRVEKLKQGQTVGKTTPYALAREFTLPDGRIFIVQRDQRMKRQKDWKSRYILGKPQEVDAIRFLFNIALTADLSFRAIARIMTERYNEVWTFDLVEQRLHNPSYAGADYLGRTQQGKHHYTCGDEAVAKDDFTEAHETIVWGHHEAIIDRGTWEQVQVKYPRNNTERKGKAEYTLSTLVKCGKCGQNMKAYTDRHGTVRLTCRKERQDGTKTDCGGSVREDELLAELLPRLTTTLDAKMIEAMEIKPVQNASNEMIEGLKGKAEKMEAEIKAKVAKLHLIDDEFLPDYQRGIKAMREEVNGIKVKISETEKQGKGENFFALWEQWKDAKAIFIETGKAAPGFDPETDCYPDADTVPVAPSTLRNALKALKTTITLTFDRQEGEKQWSRVTTMVEGLLQEVNPMGSAVLRERGFACLNRILRVPRTRVTKTLADLAEMNSLSR